MATPKISTFIIGLALIGLVVGIFIINLASFTGEYSDVSYNESDLSTYNKLSELSEQAESIRNSSSNINAQDLSFKDVIGGFFTSGYNSMILTINSVDTFSSVYDQGINDANLGASGTYLRSYLFIALLVTIFVGIIISAIIKRDI